MKTISIVIAVLVILVGGYYLYQSRTPEAPAPASAPEATTPQAAAPGTMHTVVMDATGFVPANLAIKVGDTVVFRNDDSRSRWPASGAHPTHLLCPGFDALQPMAANGSYSHTFTEAKECPMHDHLTPSIRGKITVTE